MNETNQIIGRFISTIYHNEGNFFSVVRFRLYQKDEKEIIVTGYFKPYDDEQLYAVDGQYIEHPKYGMQFRADKIEVVLPNEEESLIRFFSGPLFPGIGPKAAATIVDVLGEDCIEKIKKDPSVLNLIPKLNQKKKEIIIDGLKTSEDQLQRTVSFLQSHGMSMRNIMRIDQVYGERAIEILSENPYQMIQDIDGIGFVTADKLASNLGFKEDFPKRIEAALTSLVMEMCMATGDTYVLVEDLPEALIKKCGTSSIDFGDALFNCLLSRQLIQEENRIYHHTQFAAENIIADYFTMFPSERLKSIQQEELNQMLDQLQQEIQIQYDTQQKIAIEQFFSEDILICTGGPGTGKTTVVKAMVTLFRQLYPYAQIACCAPTGRAAKRLAELTGAECSTVHSLLKWDLETNSFGKNETEPLTLDCLIIDEFSMIDSWLFSRLLLASSQIKKICIIGDEDQLPSVSCGSVLKDLMESNLFPVVRLKTIFRQKEGSDVVTLAHHIRQRSFDAIDFKGDVAFFECSQYDIKNAVLKIVTSAIEKGYDINDVQVLAAKYNGVAGIDRLNAALQQAFNPSSKHKREWKVGYRIFREEDKILQLKNQVDDDVYNGDIGMLVEIIYPDEDINGQIRFVVDFEGILVEYTQETFNNITHAYCVSVHKSQGSEYPIVILPVAKESSFMLKRRLLYTGITRAKKSLILLGDKDVFFNGIINTEEHSRQTTLINRLLQTDKF